MGDAAGQHGHAHLRERGVDAVQIPAGAERAVIIVPVAPSHHMRGEMAAVGIGTAAPPPTNAIGAPANNVASATAMASVRPARARSQTLEPGRPGLCFSLAASFMFLRICEGDGCYGWPQVTPAGWEACKQPVPQAHSLYSISQYHTNHPDYTHDYLSAYDSAPIGSNRIHHFPRFAALLVLRVRGLLARSRLLCRHGCMRAGGRACSLAAPD